MKKILSVILALTMLLALTACGGKEDPKTEKKDTQTEQTETKDSAADKQEETPQYGKTDYEGMATGGDKKEDTTTEQSEEGKAPVEEGKAPAEEPADTNVTYKDTVIIANSSIINKTDPAGNNATVCHYVWEMVGNQLVGTDENYQPCPELAKSWERIDDMTYIFYLRDDVYFHKGQKFTANDVIYTMERARLGSYQKAKVENIKAMAALDDYTVMFELYQPDTAFLSNLSAKSLTIVCKETAEPIDKEAGRLGTNSLGYMNYTGAYYFDQWDAGVEAVLKANPNYWGDKALTETVIFRQMPEASTRTIALQTGEIDIALNVPPVEATTIAADSNCTLMEIPSSRMVYVAMNTNGIHEALTNKTVRQALNYATNPEDFIVAIREGYASTCNGPIPKMIWGYDSNHKGYTYNPDKARELLAQAGYASGLELDLYIDSSTYPGVFEILQAQWAEVGVTLNLGTGDATSLNAAMLNETHEVTVQQLGWANATAQLMTIWQTGATSNRFILKDSKVDELIKNSSTELDDNKRLAIFGELSAYLTDLACQIPLYTETLLIGTGAGVSGVEYSFTGGHDYTYIRAVAE